MLRESEELRNKVTYNPVTTALSFQMNASNISKDDYTTTCVY